MPNSSTTSEKSLTSYFCQRFISFESLHKRLPPLGMSSPYAHLSFQISSISADLDTGCLPNSIHTFPEISLHVNKNPNWKDPQIPDGFPALEVRNVYCTESLEFFCCSCICLKIYYAVFDFSLQQAVINTSWQ